MITTLGHWIGGRRLEPGDGPRGEVFDPATGEVTARVALGGAAEVEAAVQSALAAQPRWGATPPVQRARVLFRFRDLVERHAGVIEAAITAEHGKVRGDAKGELARGLEVVEFACGIPHLLKGEFAENVGTEVDCYSLRQPIGICAGITPFNFPAMVPMWMFPIALATGNAFILKPSEKVPSVPLLLAELLREAGLPDGVFSVVNGGREAVEAILDHPAIGAVSFVGSTPVAEMVHRRAAAAGKRVQALGGAKNHMLVMPDADLDKAAEALLGAGYGSAGERCMAVSVAVAVGRVGDALIERLAPRVAAIKVGPGTDPDMEMGPLVSRAHLDRVRSYIDEGERAGARLVVDGRGLRLQGYEGGFFLGGTLFDHVTPAMRIYREEIFGPVLSVVRADGLEQAIDLVNRHEFGNGTAIFTDSGEAARRFAAGVQVGMVGINVPIPVPMAFFSFGGWKRSLFGDMAVHGMEGIRFTTRLKTVSARWPGGARAAAEFTMPVMR